MNTNELMVGDWINLNYDIDYKTYESIFAPVQVTGINSDGTIDVNFTYDKSESMQDGWDPTLVHYIPLSKEILKKNGFHKNTKVGIPELYSCKSLQKHCVSIFVGDHKNSDIMWSFGETDDIFMTCKYVHELQHLFRLLKIKKEIVL